MEVILGVTGLVLMEESAIGIQQTLDELASMLSE